MERPKMRQYYVWREMSDYICKTYGVTQSPNVSYFLMERVFYEQGNDDTLIENIDWVKKRQEAKDRGYDESVYGFITYIIASFGVKSSVLFMKGKLK
jgi:hypothetical protein